MAAKRFLSYHFRIDIEPRNYILNADFSLWVGVHMTLKHTVFCVRQGKANVKLVVDDTKLYSQNKLKRLLFIFISLQTSLNNLASWAMSGIVFHV